MKKVLIGSYLLIMIGIIVIIGRSHIFEARPSPAYADGEKVYNQQCLACHGQTGKGEGTKEGTAINNQHFLSSVSDKDLFNYVKFGREGTSMPAYGSKLSKEKLNNLVAFMRSWQTEDIPFDVPKMIEADRENGKRLYNLYCMSCHGEAGAGKKKMGTSLSNPQYLKYTSNQQIWISIAYGRENTGMGPSLKGLEGVRQLTGNDITDIVTYIRSLEKK